MIPVQFSILVVLYKTSIHESATLLSLQRLRVNNKFHLWLWDNSPHSIDDKDLNGLKVTYDSIQYTHTSDNRSLAKIYNDVAKNSEGYDFLIVFDQDSEIDQAFLDVATKAIQANPDINLFVPYVKREGIIFSPGNHNYIKGSYWNQLLQGRVAAKNKVAIGSGMIICVSYLTKTHPTFDERLTFYGVDSAFVLDYGRQNDFIYVLDYNLKHSLSINEKEPVSVKLFRFKNMCSSSRTIALKASIFHRCLTEIHLLFVAAKYVVKYKSLRFINAVYS